MPKTVNQSLQSTKQQQSRTQCERQKPN